MALSLADELGSGFDDSLELSGNLGQSLAEEFGFSPNDSSGHLDLDPEFNYDDTPAPTAPSTDPLNLSERTLHHTPDRTKSRTAKSSISSTIIASSIYSEPTDDHLPIPDTTQSPIPYRTSNLKTKINRSSFLNPKIEKDPLISLSESLDTGAELFRKLRRYNEYLSLRDDELFHGMEAVAEKMDKSAGIRDAQCEVLSGLTGDLDGVGSSELSLMGGGGLGLGVVGEETEPHGMWPNEVMQDFTLHLQDIVEDTSSLHDTLVVLLESLAHSSSISTSTMRQLRGIKSQILGWRDRENLEEAALRQKEIWEAERLKRGLKGVWLGDVLKGEIEGFRIFLDGIEGRMQRLKAGGV